MCVTAFVGAGWALFSFGYTRGKDIGQDELAAYKATSEAKLPEVTSGLLSVNKDLRESLKVFERNKTLEAESTSYQQQLSEAAKARADLDVTVKKLQEELRNADENNKQLADKIKTLSGENSHLTATENHAEFLGEGHAFGVITDYSSTEINVIFDNKIQEMKVGNNIPIEFSNRKCLLTLTKILN